MKNKLLFIILLILSVVIIPMSSANAQGEQPPQPGTTNGAYDDHRKIPLTPKQQKELDQKYTTINQIHNLEASGYTSTQILQMLNLDTNVIPLSGTLNAGYTTIGLWKEPEEQPNWCGPGSATAVISNWKSVPPSPWGSVLEYMTYLATQACKYGQTYPNCTGMMSGGGTPVADWVYIVNQQINYNWYEVSYVTLATFKNDLQVDIYYTSHPLNNLIKTTYLPNWAGWSANHYVVAYAYDFNANTISYGDTAPNSANGGRTPHPFGRWTWDLSSFYSQLAPANNGLSTILW